MGVRPTSVKFSAAQVLRLLRQAHGSEIPATARLEGMGEELLVRWDKPLPVDPAPAEDAVADAAKPGV